MIGFKEFIELKEGKYPLWVRFLVGTLVLRMNSLTKKIESEKDPKKQNDLISQQNSINSYISGLSVGVSSTDTVLLNRLKKGFGGPKR